MNAANGGKEVVHPMLAPVPAHHVKKGKLVSADEAIRLIRDNDVVATEGFVGAGFAEEIAVALKEYFLKTGRPRNLTLIYAAGQGDGKERGLNHLACDGLVGNREP
jgi:propionate CoA-transferase